MLQREDQVQVRPSDGDKRGTRLAGWDPEPAVELLDIFRLAASTVVIFRTRSSCGNRPCQVPKPRSLRPRACGEYAGII
jgi:hypothetical protein